jgi:murein L,D-transpeptidase YcbB/YkuD
MRIHPTHLLLAIWLSSPASAKPAQAIEPVEIPPSIQQGIDLIYIDPEIAPAVQKRSALLDELEIDDELGSPVDLLVPASAAYTQLRRGLARYRSTWGGLPHTIIPAGTTLKVGVKGESVALLRERLGLAPGNSFDEALAKAVKSYQQVHALKADGVAGEGTIASLNLGPQHYERVLMLNLERARRLPTTTERERYILVDVGAAQLYLFEDGKVKDSMRVIVGKAASPTPMMAGLMRYASVNPYWNVPTDLVQTSIAPEVLAKGLGYLKSERLEVLSSWENDAVAVDPASVDWAAAAEGKVELRVRQLPGRANSMGDVKFMMPNDYGIYLHDTPDKWRFGNEDRWISNGCVRLEDAQRVAKWLFGEMPKGASPDREEDIQLDKPVPVYITYMTAAATSDGVTFRKDPYERDPALLARYFEAPERLALKN